MLHERKPELLVVDDEPSVLLTYRLILEKEGYEVVTADNSEHAMKQLSQRNFDLVLCDYSLEHEHTGFEVIEYARARNSSMAAVLLTGYAGIDTIEEAKHRNIAILFKPIDIQEFFDTIRSLLTRDEHEGKKNQPKTRIRPAGQRGKIRGHGSTRGTGTTD